MNIEFKKNLFKIFGFGSIVIATLVYHFIRDQTNIYELVALISFVVFIYIILLTVLPHWKYNTLENHTYLIYIQGVFKNLDTNYI